MTLALRAALTSNATRWVIGWGGVSEALVEAQARLVVAGHRVEVRETSVGLELSAPGSLMATDMPLLMGEVVRVTVPMYQGDTAVPREVLAGLFMEAAGVAGVLSLLHTATPPSATQTLLDLRVVLRLRITSREAVWSLVERWAPRFIEDGLSVVFSPEAHAEDAGTAPTPRGSAFLIAWGRVARAIRSTQLGLVLNNLCVRPRGSGGPP